MSAREWALRYATLDWRVFPLVAGEKRPQYRAWQRDATTDAEQISRYWRREPGPNIGVVTGETFDVFDIEAQHLARLARAVRTAAEGRRNNFLFWAVRRAIEEGIPTGLAASILGRAAVAAGLGAAEVERTVASASGARRP